MEPYIPFIVAFCILVIFGCVILKAVLAFRMANDTQHTIDHEINRIVSPTCTDPIQGIYEVRKWILDHYNKTPNMSTWQANAYGIMYKWLTSPIAEKMGICGATYYVGYRMIGRTKRGTQWILCYLENRPVIIDLEVGIATHARGSYFIIENITNESIPYIISSHSDTFPKYKGDPQDCGPDYTHYKLI